MPEDKKETDKKEGSRKKFSKFNSVKFGIACGIIGTILMIITTLGGIAGYFPFYNAIILDIYGIIGYSISWLGILLGAIYGFIDGFIAGWLFSKIYNRLLEYKYVAKKAPEKQVEHLRKP